MKLIQDNSSAPLSGGVDVPVNMGISDDPQDQLALINILANSLYTDKAQAVIREYSANALDANIEAGKGDQPIEVRLPNKLDPTFSVRDFGFGMSESQILNTFIKLGASTKRGSNATVGMMGIGSKAGFAYGESFLVTSYCGGTKTVYNCYRDRGAPRLARMHSAPSDAPEGVEIKVPVRMVDFADYIVKAERIYRYFPVRPIIHGAKIEWQERGVPEFQGAGWRYCGTGTSVAIMGGIAYDLKSTALPPSTPPRVRTLVELGVELDFQIGDLEIAANREGLQYKDHTVKSIKDRLDVVANEITQVFTDRISKSPSLWDAHRMYGDNFEKMGRSQYGLRTLKEVVNQGITWQGIKIGTGRFELENKENFPGVRVVEYSANVYRGAGSFSKQEQPAHTWASVKTVLVINDLPTGVNSPLRVRGFFETDKTCVERFVTFTFCDVKAQQQYWKARGLDGAPVKYLSTIPPSTTVRGSTTAGPNAHRAKHSAKVFTLVTSKPSSSYTRSQWWDSAVVDLANDSGVYVKIDRFCAHISPTRTAAPEEREPEPVFLGVANLKEHGLLKTPLYGFKPAMLDKLGTGWVELSVHVASEFGKWIAANRQAIADADAAQAHAEWLPPDTVKSFAPGTAMYQYLSAFAAMKKSGCGPAALVEAVRKRRNFLLPTTLDALPNPSFDLNALSAAALSTYPLLNQIHKYMSPIWDKSSLLKPVAEYVKLVNK